MILRITLSCGQGHTDLFVIRAIIQFQLYVAASYGACLEFPHHWHNYGQAIQAHACTHHFQKGIFKKKNPKFLAVCFVCFCPRYTANCFLWAQREKNPGMCVGGVDRAHFLDPPPAKVACMCSLLQLRPCLLRTTIRCIQAQHPLRTVGSACLM